MSDKQWKFLQDVSNLIEFARHKGYKLTGGELYRTKEQQEIYLEKGLSKTRDSQHLKRLAIDFNLFVDGQIMWTKCPEWEALGEYWEALDENNRWGGNYKSFTDVPHFEKM
jgi:peptidoglycan L-alanyl-D-glutamate endopeptidase CwlK